MLNAQLKAAMTDLWQELARKGAEAERATSVLRCINTEVACGDVTLLFSIIPMWGIVSANEGPGDFSVGDFCIDMPHVEVLVNTLVNRAFGSLREAIPPGGKIVITAADGIMLLATETENPGSIDITKGNPLAYICAEFRMYVALYLRKLNYMSVRPCRSESLGGTAPVAPTFKQTARGKVGEFYFLKMWSMGLEEIMNRILGANSTGLTLLSLHAVREAASSSGH